MHDECSFRHFQYEFGYRNENVLRVKAGYLKKSDISNRDKMGVLKINIFAV